MWRRPPSGARSGSPTKSRGGCFTEADGAFPYVDMSRAKALYILQDVRRLAADRGLKITWPVDRAPCWEVAHLAYLVAREHDAGPRFIASVYRARWEEGRDISDRATIAAIGANLGLDPVALATAADDPAVRRNGLRALQAIDTDGVFGVPFFIQGRDKYWGLDRLPEFVAAVRGDALAIAGVEPVLAHGPGGPGGDQGHAGGCG